MFKIVFEELINNEVILLIDMKGTCREFTRYEKLPAYLDMLRQLPLCFLWVAVFYRK